jgi:glycosyltransferase involved in cell wall biosynthesis
MDRPGGASRLAWDEALFFASSGHRVTILACAVTSDAPEVELHSNIRVLRYRVREYPTADLRRASAHQNAARDILRQHVIEHVHLVHGHAPLTYLAACNLYDRQARTVYTIHSPTTMEMDIEWPGGSLKQNFRRWFGLPLLKRMERHCLKRSAVVLADSEFTRQQMLRIHGPELAAQIEIIPGWVDLGRFKILAERTVAKRALGWPLDVPVLFTLRRLVRRMGLDGLVRAVAILLERGQKVHLVIGGAGPLRRELEQLAQALNVFDSVRFIGRVPDEDLPTMYGACDAFVLPTAELECFGLIALEALACGRPVLATPVAAIPEVLCNFEKQWLAKSADEVDIAEIIGAYVLGLLPAHSPSELRSRAEELYSHDKRLAQLAAILLGPAGAPNLPSAAELVSPDVQR